MIKRKEYPNTDDYQVSLTPAHPSRTESNRWPLLALIVLAAAACWLGMRLHAPRPAPLRPSLGPTVTASFFRMGQGCSILLISPSGRAVLIDTGTTLTEESRLSAALKRSGRTGLNAVILTTSGPQAIGGLPRLLATIPVRGPVLIPVPLDQFLAQGGRSAELCREAITRRGLPVFLCQDYLESHPGLLGGNTLLTSRIIPGDPATSEVVRMQFGREMLVSLANLSPLEEEGALALRGYLSCDAVAVPPEDQKDPVSHELLADTSAEDIIVPPAAGPESGPPTRTEMTASGAHLFVMDPPNPMTVDFASQNNDIKEIPSSDPAASLKTDAGPERP